MLILSRDQCREVDRIAIEQYGIPGIVLMENAGRSATREILKLAETVPLSPRGRGVRGEGDAAGKRRRTPLTPGPSPRRGEGGTALRVAIVCGGGNNGGDGYVIARHLHIAGAQVSVFSAIDPGKLSGDAAINRHIIEKTELPRHTITDTNSLDAAASEWASAHIVVDALLGTGFSGDVRPEMRSIVERINALNGPRVVAIDVPSGLDCQSGEPAGACIRADLTVTFVALKSGFETDKAKPFLGRVVVAGIGIPPELLKKLSSASGPS